MTPEGRRLALVVASSHFSDKTLQQLVAPGQDAADLARVLADATIGGFEVKKLINRPSHEVRREIEAFFTGRKRNDLLLLYFSGHGVKDDDGRLYLATTDTERGLLRATAVPATFVNETMTASRSRRQVLILDCCHSGAFARGMVAKGGESVGIRDRFEGRGRVVLTASNATQYAFQGDEIIGEGARSVFTHHLVRGLETGEADLDGDGRISLDELYDYVYDQVTDETPQQTPGKWTFDLQGEIFIARNPHLVELPRELQQAIKSSFAGVRESAVRELDRLLRGSHPGLALAAHAALTCLVADDSRRVSTAAATSLAAYAEAEQEAGGRKRGEVEAERIAAQKAKAESAAREKAEQERQARQRELEMLYREVQTKVASEAWAEAKDLCQRIEALEGPGYRDVDELLGLAEAGLRQEQAQKERQAQLDQLYEQARTALQQERWEEVRRHCADIETLQPGYRDVDELLRAAEAGLCKEEKERQVQLAQLYEHLQAAAVQEDWSHVLALGKQIQETSPDYRDVPALVVQAKAQMRRRWYKRLPAWAGIVGGAALGGLGCGWLWVGLGLAGGHEGANGPPVPPTARRPRRQSNPLHRQQRKSPRLQRRPAVRRSMWSRWETACPASPPGMACQLRNSSPTTVSSLQTRFLSVRCSAFLPAVRTVSRLLTPAWATPGLAPPMGW